MDSQTVRVLCPPCHRATVRHVASGWYATDL